MVRAVLSRLVASAADWLNRVRVWRPAVAQARFEAFLRADEVRTLDAAAYVRFVFVALLIGLEAMPFLVNPWRLPGDLYAFVIKLGFLPVGLAQLWLARSDRYRPWMKYGLLALDVAWLAFYQIVPNPWEHASAAVYAGRALLAYQQQTLKWLWLFFVWVAFNVSAGYVRAFAAYVIAAFVLQPLWLATLPGLHLHLGPTDGPGNIDVSLAIDNILVTLFMTIGFIFVAANNRRLAGRFFAAEDRRNALSRFFSPNLVDRLDGDPATAGRIQTRAAVLFTDMKGFSTFAETRTPDEVLDHLQTFHGLIESEIFSRDGTLEKYIGDAVMAVFGAPVARDDDAARAFDCAVACLATVDAWNLRRAVQGLPPVRIGIGLDYGEVVGGVIGRDRNMSYAVVGATVNLASRMESLTRTFAADLVMSDRFHQALLHQGALMKGDLTLRREQVAVHNLQDQIVWVLNPTRD